MMTSKMLELRGVSWRSGGRPILNDISFDVAAGDFVSVIGPSGAGKSSLFKVIVRFVESTSGTILLEGKDIKTMNVIQLRRQIGFLLQESYMFDGTVRDNITYGLKLQNKPVNEAKIKQMLAHVHLFSDDLDRDVAELSGGERQRVAIVRMLLNEPKILLLDEITSALDLANTLEVEHLIAELQKSLGITIMMVSHDFEQAKRLGGRTIFLANGAIIEQGSVNDLFLHPKNELTIKFLQGGLI
jgi:putative ABC transport system ATP-binding protein